MKKYLIEVLNNLDTVANIVMWTMWSIMMLSFWRDSLHDRPMSYGFIRGYWIILWASVALCLLLPSKKFWE